MFGFEMHWEPPKTPAPKLSVWVCDDGVDWVVALNHDDAAAVMRDFSGEPLADQMGRGWAALPDDKELRIQQDGWPAPGQRLRLLAGTKVVIEGAEGQVQRLGEFLVVTEGTIYHVATAAYWAKQGRGFLCSTVF